MKLRQKLTGSYALIAMLVWAVGVLVAWHGKQQLRQALTSHAVALADELIDNVERHVWSTVDWLRLYGQTSLLRECVAASNDCFAGMPSAQTVIDQRDRAWIGMRTGEQPGFMREILESRLSRELSRVCSLPVSRASPSAFAELFVTDRFGATVAASGAISDYRQDDDSWWRIAATKGVSIGDVHYDESADVRCIDIGVAVWENDHTVAGLIKAVISVDDIMVIVRDSAIAAPSMHARQAPECMLVSAAGHVICSTLPSIPMVDAARLIDMGGDMRMPGRRSGTFSYRDAKGRVQLAAFARSGRAARLHDMDWIVVLPISATHSPAPAGVWLRGGVVFFLLGGLVIVVGWLFSRSISRPLAILEHGTSRIAHGDLGHRIGMNRRDEVGRLSHAFDQMAGRLQATREALQTEVGRHRKSAAMLKKTTAELARSNHDLEQFAYVASHDLQSPLRAVTGYLAMFRRRHGEDLGTDARRLLEKAAEAAARMQALIRDLLEFSRVSRADPAYRDVAAGDIVDQAMSDLRETIRETGATVSVGALTRIQADPGQMTRLFTNLLGNAIKFRSRDAPAIRIEAERGEGDVTFSVSDNGIGIAPEHHERVFEVFKRLHTTDEYAGSGIGLAVCRRIVQQHGGRIWVDDRPGAGTTIRFTIPLHPNEQSRPHAASQKTTQIYHAT